MLPRPSYDRLLAAMQEYDARERPLDPSDSWKQNMAHKYALEHEGKLYPVKKIVAMAADTGVDTFSQSYRLRRYLTGLGLHIVGLRDDATDDEEDEEPEDFPDEQEDGTPSTYGSLDEWLREYPAKNPFTKRIANEYPRWLLQLCGDIHIVPLSARALSFRLSGELLQDCWFNTIQGFVYVRLYDPSSEDIELLRNRLSKPSTVKQYSAKPGKYGLPSHRFYVSTDNDYALLQALAERQIDRVLGEPKEIEAPDETSEDRERGSSLNYWWVNQGSTYKEEREGGFLWAPQNTKKGGPAFTHWRNMTRLKPGDWIFHYSNGAIRAVGRVVESARDSSKPVELESGVWRAEGWRAKIEYMDLVQPIALKSIPVKLRESKFGSAFNVNGGVNEGYLYPVPKELAEGIVKEFAGHLPSKFQDAVVTGSAPTPRVIREPPGEWEHPKDRSKWLFQASPKYYKLAERLKRAKVGDISNWTVTSDWKSMKPGDLMILWQAGKDAGVYATAELVSAPYEHTYTSEEAPWLRLAPGESKDVKRVDFKYTRILEEPILRARILAHPVLSKMMVIRFPRATNYPLTGDEWDALQELLDGTADRPVGPTVKKVSFEEIWQALRAQGLYYSREVLANYLLALQTKRFVILTGISGTGKTRLAQAVAGYLSDQVSGPYQGYEDEADKSYRVVAVRPDWTDNRGLLGYYNPIIQEYTRTPFLDLLLEARQDADVASVLGWEPRAFFIVLDEMNLARVEHYFSDFLSAMESDEEIALYDETEVSEHEEIGDGDVPSRLKIPKNIFFTGTVNVDETTYMFSPKVLDRAFTIELNEVRLEDWGRHEVEGLAGRGADDAVNLVSFPGTLKFERKPSFEDWAAFGKLLNGELQSVVVGLNKLLEEKNRHFGYRSAGEIARFVRLASEQTEGEVMLWAALDLAILQKVLPKLSGTQQELEEVLTRLHSFATFANATIDKSVEGEKPRLPRTAGKVVRMLQRLREQGFTAFIE